MLQIEALVVLHFAMCIDEMTHVEQFIHDIESGVDQPVVAENVKGGSSIEVAQAARVILHPELARAFCKFGRRPQYSAVLEGIVYDFSLPKALSLDPDTGGVVQEAQILAGLGPTFAKRMVVVGAEVNAGSIAYHDRPNTR